MNRTTKRILRDKRRELRRDIELWSRLSEGDRHSQALRGSSGAALWYEGRADGFEIVADCLRDRLRIVERELAILGRERRDLRSVRSPDYRREVV